MTQNKRVLLATGGTGGHVFPAIALGKFLQENGYEVEFSTDARGAKYFAQYNFKFRTINSASPSGSITKKLKAILQLALGFGQCFWFIHKFDVIVGFGGYASFAPVLTGKLFGKKIILHEQNAVLGKVNRVLQKFADHVALSFAHTKFANNGKYVGSFVRDDFKFSTLSSFKEKLNLLIIGGSQGAKIFSEIFPKALAGLNFNVTHQVPEAEIARAQAAYAELGIEAEIKPFFVDIKQRIENSHLVVSRAGSSSIFELITIGRPAIFVPLKTAMDNHQYENARELAENDAAWLVNENENTVAEITAILADICASPTKLVKKAEMMHNQNQIDSKQRMLSLIQ